MNDVNPIAARKSKKTHLTPTGLLKEGVGAQNPSMSDIVIDRQLAAVPRSSCGNGYYSSIAIPREPSFGKDVILQSYLTPLS
jgi:hypothetical protein